MKNPGKVGSFSGSRFVCGKTCNTNVERNAKSSSVEVSHKMGDKDCLFPFVLDFLCILDCIFRMHIIKNLHNTQV